MRTLATTAPAKRVSRESDLLAPVERAREHFVREVDRLEEEEMPFLRWSLQVPEAKTGTLDFGRFPYQVEPYEVMGTDVREFVLRKATQIGATALLVRWALYEADRNGHTILYVFPTADDVYDMSDARISPMFENSEYLSKRAGNPFNKALRRVGTGFVYFRGSESKRKLDSVDGDGLALDEYDTLNQGHIPDAERRLSGPLSAGLIRRVGVPSLPKYGISEKYEESDQRKWLVKCSCQLAGVEDHETKKPLLTPRGRAWQAIDFWHNVDQKADPPRIVCEGCGEPLDVATGRWVAQNPDSRIPGFHMSKLIVPGIERVPRGGLSLLQKVIAASRSSDPVAVEVFYNKDLGMPYLSKEAGLDEESIKATQREFSLEPGFVGDGQWPVTMGVDVASERALTVRISQHLSEYQKRALWIGEIEDSDEGKAFAQLRLLTDRYSVNMCAIDAAPESRMSREFQAACPGRVYLIRLPDKQKQVLAPHEDIGEYSVRRTEAFDAMVEGVRRQNNLLPILLPAGYMSQMTAPRRRIVKDDMGNAHARWESNRPDDYALAEVYDTIATEIWWLRQGVEEALEEREQPLDEMVDIHRSPVTDYSSEEYVAGPDDMDVTFGRD